MHFKWFVNPAHAFAVAGVIVPLVAMVVSIIASVVTVSYQREVAAARHEVEKTKQVIDSALQDLRKLEGWASVNASLLQELEQGNLDRETSYRVRVRLREMEQHVQTRFALTRQRILRFSPGGVRFGDEHDMRRFLVENKGMPVLRYDFCFGCLMAYMKETEGGETERRRVSEGDKLAAKRRYLPVLMTIAKTDPAVMPRMAAYYAIAFLQYEYDILPSGEVQDFLASEARKALLARVSDQWGRNAE